jgi:hypothetical protein
MIWWRGISFSFENPGKLSYKNQKTIKARNVVFLSQEGAFFSSPQIYHAPSAPLADQLIFSLRKLNNK